MAPKDTKIWNEDLVLALRMKEDVSRKEGKRDQITWKQGADIIEGVRKDIYAVRIVLSFPTSGTESEIRCEGFSFLSEYHLS